MGRRLKLEFIRTISELSIATSVPFPIAIPTSAVAREGLSFTPSPIKAIISPVDCLSFLETLACPQVTYRHEPRLILAPF
jgi:hypothetical protein